MAEFRRNLLNAMAQVFPLLVLRFIVCEIFTVIALQDWVGCGTGTRLICED